MHCDFVYLASDFPFQRHRKGHSRGLIWLRPYVSWFVQYSALIIHFEASTNKVSSTLEADNVKTEPDLVETCVKFQEDDKDSIHSVYATFCLITMPRFWLTDFQRNVSPCNLLSRRCGNPNARPTDPFAPWRYSVRPFDRSNIPSEAAKRKALHQDIKDYACKRRKLWSVHYRFKLFAHFPVVTHTFCSHLYQLLFAIACSHTTDTFHVAHSTSFCTTILQCFFADYHMSCTAQFKVYRRVKVVWWSWNSGHQYF